MLDVLEITDVTAPCGLKRIWKLLDDVFQNLAHEAQRCATALGNSSSTAWPAWG